MNGFIQQKKIGCSNVDYWNFHWKSVEIDDQSAYNSQDTNGQEFEATPLLAFPCIPEQSFFQPAQDDSFRYSLSSIRPYGIITSPLNNNNMPNLLNMSNTLNTDYPFLDTPQKIISDQNNIFESNTQEYNYLAHSQNDRHLPLSNMLPINKNKSTIKQSSSPILSCKRLPQQNSCPANDVNGSIATNGIYNSFSLLF
ncbi:hypothetical protein C1645_747188 [Glomus cerebriforme]|uniref:Uncharacterized protein n=1 Tax=Glomus cerebriforme TaxID=658196 RepID=A0A397TT26_9GLOM|nr:hypothetical protein C1645_747188 [Glomus cerebriforme]